MVLTKFSKSITFFSILIIIGIASLFRLWQLGAIPPGLYPDVALNGNEALETLKTGDFKVFYPENNGREGLMMWLIAGSFSIFGASVWAIKIVAAVSGVLTVFGLYLLTKELLKIGNLKTEVIALITSFFLATSFWHTNFSRIGFRAILLPLVSVFAFYFLFRGFNVKKIWLFLISGVFFGLGFYTYTSYRMVILLLPLLLVCLPFLKKDRKTLLAIGCWLLVIFAIALPIGIYFLQHPQDFMSRMTGVSVFSAENPVKAFLESLVKHLGMFNFFGDPNWRHNFSESPMLPRPLGMLFLTGIIFSFKEIFSAIRTKNRQRLMVPIFLFSWFISMLLPGALTREGLPHALRVVGVIPVVYIFTGLGAYWLYSFISSRIKQKKPLLVISFLLLAIVSFGEFNKYFFVWARNPNAQGAFTTNYVEVGNRLNSLPDNTPKYVIVNEGGVLIPFLNGIPMPAQTPMFIERTRYGEPRATYLLPEDLNQVENKDNAVIILLKQQ